MGTPADPFRGSRGRVRFVRKGARRVLGRSGPARSFRRWRGDLDDPLGAMLDEVTAKREREREEGSS